MSRFAALIAFPFLSLAACAPHVAVVPARAAHAPSPEPAPLAVDVRITRPDGAVLLAGRLDVAPRRPVVLEHDERGAGAAELSIDARPREDGTYLLDVHWKDVAADGRRVEWTPSLVVARGAGAHARVAWEGGGRELSVSVR